jgi:HAE1 family hydrophobic/amphiphilic exporter-1
MSLSEPFIRRPVMTMVVVIAALVFGVAAYRLLPVAALPDVDYPVITLTAAFPGYDPATMASNVASPLEQQLMQIQGLNLMTSQNTQGQTQILLQFSLDKNITQACADVQAAITRAQPNLPSDMPTPPQYQVTNPNAFPFLIVAVTSPVLTEGQLYDVAYNQVSQRLSMIDGISQVQVWGAMRAVRIQVDPQQLYNRGLTMKDVTTAVQAGTVLEGTGQLEGPETTLIVRPNGQLSKPEDYAKLIIAMRGGAPVYLKDVAKCEESTNNLYFYNLFYSKATNQKALVIGIGCTQAPNTNTIEVTKKARAALKEIQASLPGTVTAFVPFEAAKPIQASVDDVEQTLLLAFALVVLIIFLFLGRIVNTVIPAIALPLSMLLTFIAMYLMGFSIDNLSLLSLTLAIGFLVDDAIVFLENMTRHVEAGERGVDATLNSAREISTTILSMTLTLACVFIPLLFMGGQLGRIFREFSMTIVVAILASGLVSLTVTPLMCARIIGVRDEQKPSVLERWSRAAEDRLRRGYRAALGAFLRVRWLAVILWAASLGGAIWLYQQLPKTFLPIGDSGLVRGLWITADAVSPSQIEARQRQVEQVLAEDPAVMYAFSLTGLGSLFSSNEGLVFYVLRDASERPPIDVVNNRIKARILKEVPGVNPLFNPMPVLNLSTGATSTLQGDYAYSISGLDPTVVQHAALALQDAMKQNPAFMSVSSDMYPNSVQLKVDINRDLASAYGITAADIETLLGDAFSQNYCYLIKSAVQQYQVIVESGNHYRQTAKDLGMLYLTATKSVAPRAGMPGANVTLVGAAAGGAGRLVPLSAVATWKETLAPLQVNHVDSFPSATIYFDLAPNVAVGEATAQLDQLATKLVPPGLIHSFQGQAQVFGELAQSAGPLGVVAIFVMFVILAILYESYMHPLTVLSAAPVATVGGFLTLYLFGAQFSLYAFVGLFMLIGIVMKNGIMMVDFAIQRQAEGRTPRDAVMEACQERLRPILMTTLAAVFGALPMALALGSDGSSRQPLGLVIVGGLLVAQLLTLFVTPAIYLYFEAFQDKVLDRVALFARGAAATAEKKAAVVPAK